MITTDLYIMRLDAAMNEWNRHKLLPAERVSNVMCDVCLKRCRQLLVKGHKAICLDCLKLLPLSAGNVKSSIPQGEYIYEHSK